MELPFDRRSEPLRESKEVHGSGYTICYEECTLKESKEVSRGSYHLVRGMCP